MIDFDKERDSLKNFVPPDPSLDPSLDPTQLWLPPRDYPVFTQDLVSSVLLGLRTTVLSDSGLRWTVIRVDKHSREQPCNKWKVDADISCWALQGHDHAHLPMTGLLKSQLAQSGVELCAVEVSRPVQEGPCGCTG